MPRSLCLLAGAAIAASRFLPPTTAAAIIVAVSVVMPMGVPANATHKPYCGKRWVETGTFYVDKNCPSNLKKATAHAKMKCMEELEERGEDTYGSNFTGLEKTGAHCNLQKKGDICQFWCVCSGEPCWKPYMVSPGNIMKKRPFLDPPGISQRPDKGLRAPIRPPFGGPTIPKLHRR